MPQLPKDYVLKPGQTPAPILWREPLPMPAEWPSTKDCIRMLFGVFGKGKSKRLATWGRAPQDPNGPHWIGLRNGIAFHIDPGYLRFTHQLIVYNDGWGVTGWDREPGDPLAAGVLFCCDTHSPHQVVPDPRLGRGLYYLAASMDAKVRLPYEVARRRLLDFVSEFDPARAEAPAKV